MPLPSDLYDRDYFLSDKCEGWDRFKEDRSLSPLKTREVALLDLKPGVRVLDAGCGRGEVLLTCAAAGAQVAGFDYAQAAVELTREVLSGVEGADIRRADITDLPYDDASFDRILFGDVIEHLDPDQAAAGLRELRRVLAPGGKLVVHTAPNLLFLKLGWPVSRLALKVLGHGETVQAMDHWIAESKSYHVNEQSIFMLRRAVRDAGFTRVEGWIDADVARSGEHHLTAELGGGGAMGLGARLAGTRPMRTFLGNDLYAIGYAG